MGRTARMVNRQEEMTVNDPLLELQPIGEAQAEAGEKLHKPADLVHARTSTTP